MSLTSPALPWYKRPISFGWFSRLPSLPRAPITENRRGATASIIFFELAIAARTGMELSAAAKAISERRAITSHRTTIPLGLLGVLEAFFRAPWKVLALLTTVWLPQLTLILSAAFSETFFSPRKHQMAVANDLARLLALGLPLHQAMAQMPRDFSPEECLLVQIATETNQLPEILQELGHRNLLPQRLFQCFRSTPYFLTVGLFITLLTFFLSENIQSKFQDIYYQLGAFLPSLTNSLPFSLNLFFHPSITPLIIAFFFIALYRVASRGKWLPTLAFALIIPQFLFLISEKAMQSSDHFFFLVTTSSLSSVIFSQPNQIIILSQLTGIIDQETISFLLFAILSSLVLGFGVCQILLGISLQKLPQSQPQKHQTIILRTFKLALILSLAVSLVTFAPIIALTLFLSGLFGVGLARLVRCFLRSPTLDKLCFTFRKFLPFLPPFAATETNLLRFFGIALRHHLPEERFLPLLHQYGRTGWRYPIKSLLTQLQTGTPLLSALISSGVFSGNRLARLQALRCDSQLGQKILDAVEDMVLTHALLRQRREIQYRLIVYAFFGLLVYAILLHWYSILFRIPSLIPL